MKFRDIISRFIHFERIIDESNDKLRYYLAVDRFTERAINDKRQGVSMHRYSKSDVVVSLTTHGNRISEVYLAIESIMQGTMKPNRIVLWISDEYRDIDLSIYLKNQCQRGLEIKYCKDIRSYTKLIPMLKENRDSIIVTIDDDNIYCPDMLEKLYRAHCETPEFIIANRVHRVKLNSNNIPLSYFEWDWESSKEDASYLNFITGVGGVLYPPNCFCQEVFNEEVFLDICKYADDVWFYAMALKSKRKIRKIYTHSRKSQEYLENIDAQEMGLRSVNLRDNKNDVQLRDVFNRYSLYHLLKE